MKTLLRSFILLLVITLLLSSCTISGDPPAVTPPGTEDCSHIDADDNGKCDGCKTSLLITVDFYAVNDLHGKLDDTDDNPGVDELSTYLKDKRDKDAYSVLLSSGDMWQGSAESNFTEGAIVTEWMNYMEFDSMTLGNHEYDWGQDAIVANSELADFPFLAINVYDSKTKQRVSYCDASAIVERGGIKIGIIGAIGNCYSSISGDVSDGFYFKTGNELTALVKAEATRLRNAGVDYIVYSIHDGSDSGGGQNPSYDTVLSNGFVDLVFEGHTHQKYVYTDEHGVCHLQGGGENKNISHAEVSINSVTGTAKVVNKDTVASSTYASPFVNDDPMIDTLLAKYNEQIAPAYVVWGNNYTRRDDAVVEQILAGLYYEFGVDMWGDEYDITLGGGFIRTRSPYDLAAGEIQYLDIYSLLPFDNNLVLCRISGYNLRTKFLESTRSDYYISYGTNGLGNIDDGETYYIVTDTYTSSYDWNKLTEIARVEERIFARDLLAEYIKAEGFAASAPKPTSIMPNIVPDNDPVPDPDLNPDPDPNPEPDPNPDLDPEPCTHADTDDNGLCDDCTVSLIVTVDFYAINDLHGKLADSDTNEGVDELSTYINEQRKNDDHSVLLSSGDMWQGSSESNLTEGAIITEWMNYMGFASMTLGNHEYDWGEEAIIANGALADFPFLAINAFDRSTDQRVSYCDASAVIDLGEIQIGIIGAIGDCYSSISGDKSSGFYFKTGAELTALVKAESERLRSGGVDFIVYSIHDGYGSSSSNTSISASQLQSYYSTELSQGYVDLVFEGHTHQRYVMMDSYDVYHIQNGGENQNIAHAEVRINSVTGSVSVSAARTIPASTYTQSADDTIVAELLEKYKEDIAAADVVLGYNAATRTSDEIKQTVAQLYYEFALEKWGSRYDIVLGGGYLSTRSPYDLAAGEVTYSDVYSLLPFDNHLVLCTVKGSDLKSKFFESSNSNYYVACGEYGETIKNDIDPDEYYFIVVDTYTSSYAPNNLTEVERATESIFARDLLAEHIKSGGFNA